MYLGIVAYVKIIFNLKNAMHILEVKATEKIQEVWALLEQHREELTTDKKNMVLNPNINMYKNMEDMGMLFTLVLCDGEKIVGYSVNILGNNLHYSDLLVSQNDLLFVLDSYRKSKWGLKLIQETEKLAKEKGAKLIMWHGKPNTSLSKLMPKLGYNIQDITYSRII